MNPLYTNFFYKAIRDFLLKDAKQKHWKTIFISVGSTLIISKVLSSYADCHDGVILAAKKKFFKTLRFVKRKYNLNGVGHVTFLNEENDIRKLPWVKKKIDEEIGKTMGDLKADADKQLKGLEYYRDIPEVGWDQAKIVAEIEKLMGLGDYKVTNISSQIFKRIRNSKALSGICHKPAKAREEVMTTVYGMTAYTNPLNPDAFPGVRKMEAEVVRMTGNLFHGDKEMIGTMTSGGSESLILAVLAYRGYARETRGVTRPNIVMPVTGHVAVDKAGHLLGVHVRHVPVDPVTQTPRVQEMRRACDRNTIALLVSAPQYAHGVMDPITEVAALGLRLNIPVHVDACLGGFLIVFAEKIGLGLDPFDFRVPGVTSISADTHKFGYAPKV